MEIITKTEGNKATMEISGWLDTQTAPQLGEALSGLEDSITSLVFDFTNLQSEIIIISPSIIYPKSIPFITKC